MSTATQLAHPLTDPRDILARALQRFDDGLVLATALGPQSIVILDLLQSMGATVPTFFLDTGLHFPETLALRWRLEHHFGIRIQAVMPTLSLEDQADAFGDNLWRRDPDRCCHLRKVLPLAKVLEGRAAWITGLRRDQGPTRANLVPFTPDPLHGLVKVSPLAFWTRDRVFTHIEDRGLPFHPLLSQGYRSVGCAPCTRPCQDPGDERAGRWAGQEKTECGIHWSKEDD